ncbi:MAG: putative zinc protease [Verrucomicrobiae bacterium]|nr:putative zinc protease [Verrucomicrobiae bacterium]
MTGVYPITTLPNGLRIITAPMPQMGSVSVGIWIGIGGRYESRRVTGISHFIEHLLFKGTHRRTAKQISQTVEGVGGYLNAFTGEENTCYYAKASDRHMAILLDVLADMYRHPKLANTDIAKERQVIKEELLMYRDQPDHYVQELLTESLWPDHPLGRALAGTPATLDAIDRATVVNFKANHYTPGKTIVAVAGHCEHADIVARVEKIFPGPRAGKPGRYEPARDGQRAPQLKFLTKPVEQAHLAIALRSYSRHDSRRFALKLLSVILGENMSSRLFQTIREKYGLAYSIQSATSYFSDTGAFLISAGLDAKRLPKALKLILQELKKLAVRAPSAVELRRAKDYAIGQMRLGLESTSNQMMWCGEHLLAYGQVQTPAEIEQKIEAVTTDQVQEVAVAVFRDQRLNAAVITPTKEERVVSDLLSFA